MSAPLFSIIIPTFRAETVIAQCLESVRLQTCDRYEILIIDGGSNDKTLERILSQAAQFGERLTLHSRMDRGVYDAMNIGIGLAKGEWLYFLGADDRLHDQHTLQSVAAFIHEHPTSDLVYGDVIMRSNSSRYDGSFDLEKLLFQKNICHQAVFYRKTTLDKTGGYNLRYRIWADWDLNIRCFQHPALIRHYMDVVIADFNDISGLSRQGPDLELQKLLPLFARQDAERKRNFPRRIAHTLRRIFTGV